MNYKRIITVQDISCVGQCSATVALPVLSLCGFETAVLPCSLLSNHTTGFDSYSFKDLSRDMVEICDQWKEQGISFSAIYSGYIGNTTQLANLQKVMDACLEKDAIKIMDPAMADDGELYPGFDCEFVNEVKKAAAKADYLLPNMTEACLLTDTTYTDNYDEVFVKGLLDKLSAIGCKNIVITGVSYSDNTTGVVVYENGVYSYHSHEKVARSSPGTGDVFASVFTGAILKGNSALKSADMASQFVVECLKETMKYPQHRYGPVFEPVLAKLIEIMK
ncbi:MAG: pyridoxamine kinase [Oscillospiraceae bacterium]|nr:pyridoxamine kinase [Oscillospiraceae bacterium]